MKITLLGHASVLVEMDGATCLMDPIFNDPFEEGAVVSCPRRTVYPQRLPHLDILIVSHRHPDHFDISSLARLDRDCDALCPADPLIVYALEKLRFARIHPVHTMAEIRGPGFELYPTRSEVRSVKEFGMVFRDASGVFWNQVDSFLSADTIRAVRERFATIDLLFAMYASQNFEFFDSHTVRLPYPEHRRNLQNVLDIDPRMVAPGAAGFRFCGDHAWLNAYLFPISRERFVADLARLAPGIEVRVMNPGDVFQVSADATEHLPGVSEVAVTEFDDSDRLTFDPTARIPALHDPNPDRYPREHLRQIIDDFLGTQLGGYVRTATDQILERYREIHARYGIAVIFPDNTTRWYRFDFNVSPPACRDGPGLLDMVHRIAASALVGWIEHRKSFFYVRAYSRRHAQTYRLGRDGGRVLVEAVALPDLLMHYLLNVAAGSEFAAREQVDLQIQALTGH